MVLQWYYIGPIVCVKLRYFRRAFAALQFISIIAFSSLRNFPASLPRRRGSAILAINEWMTYFNVRTRNIEVNINSNTQFLAKKPMYSM